MTAARVSFRTFVNRLAAYPQSDRWHYRTVKVPVIDAVVVIVWRRRGEA